MTEYLPVKDYQQPVLGRTKVEWLTHPHSDHERILANDPMAITYLEVSSGLTCFQIYLFSDFVVMQWETYERDIGEFE